MGALPLSCAVAAGFVCLLMMECLSAMPCPVLQEISSLALMFYAARLRIMSCGIEAVWRAFAAGKTLFLQLTPVTGS